MPATWAKGHTFVDGETVNHGDLHEHLESATVSGIDRSNIDSTLGFPGVIQLNRPSDLSNQEPYAHPDILWWTANDSSGNPASCRVGGYPVILSGTSATVEAGELVQADGVTSGVIQVTKAALSRLVFGVSAFRVVAGAKGVAIAQGITAVRVASDASAVLLGKAAQLSSTDSGKAKQVGAAGSGFGHKKFGLFVSNPFTGKSGDSYAWVRLFR